MADATATGAEDAASQRATEQARLRKERREAKIKSGGSARLNRITGVNGGLQRDPIPTFAATQPSAPPATPSNTPQSNDDPPAIDISQHFYTPARRPGFDPQDSLPQNGLDADALNNDLLRQMMMGGGMGATPPGFMPGAAGAEAQDPFATAAADNPVMKALLEQLGGSENLFAPMKGQMPGGPQAPTQQPAATENKLDHLWRVAHALFALALGICIAFSTTFAGSKFEREQATLASIQRANEDWAGQLDEQDLETEWITKAFWVWAASEAMLLTARFLLFDNSRSGAAFGGMADQVMGAFLNPGVHGAIKMVMRYFRWIMAIRTDLGVVIFVLGLCTWFRGG